jgi:hypothetical protein
MQFCIQALPNAERTAADCRRCVSSVDRQQQVQEIGGACIRYHSRQLALDKLQLRGDPVNQPLNLDGFGRWALSLTGTSIEARHSGVPDQHLHSAKQTLETDVVIIFERPPCPASITDPLFLYATLDLRFYEFLLDISQQAF